jgi:hypothetical protein
MSEIQRIPPDRPFPGLSMPQTLEVFNRSDKPRCGKCPACRRVEASKRLYRPDPPFDHATNLTVEYWNRLLYANPCEQVS